MVPMKGRRTGIWELGHSPRGTSGFFQDGGGGNRKKRGEGEKLIDNISETTFFLNNKPSKQFSSSY